MSDFGSSSHSGFIAFSPRSRPSFQACTDRALARAVPPRAAPNADLRKRKFESLESRVQNLEQEQGKQGDHLGNLELFLELETAYRFLRIEGSLGLPDLFIRVE